MIIYGVLFDFDIYWNNYSRYILIKKSKKKIFFLLGNNIINNIKKC